MGTDQSDIYSNFRYRMYLSGQLVAAFSKATLPDTTTKPNPENDKEATNSSRILAVQFADRTLILERGISQSTALLDWISNPETKTLSILRKDITIALVNEAGMEVSKWEMTNAWPNNFNTTQIDSLSNEVIIELLDLQVEQVTRIN